LKKNWTCFSELLKLNIEEIARSLQAANERTNAISKTIDALSMRRGNLATPGDFTIAAIARLLALAEELLVRHDWLVRMRIFHVLDISTVFGHANHEPHALF
jgi:hypothetical protein